MATKPTIKSQNYNKDKLSKSLERLVDRVSARGVFVVDKPSSGSYRVINYLTGNPVYNNVPTRAIAEKMRDRLNSKKGYSWYQNREINQLLDEYQKQCVDCVYYIYTMDNTKSDIAYDVTYARKTEAETRIASIIFKLKHIV